jgi:hemoglobin/transferrin/lactoferrin receptor protein
MLKTALSALLITALAGTAAAADLSADELAPAPVAAPVLYLGVHAGYGFGHIDGTTTNDNGVVAVNAARESADQDVDGWLAGAQVGYNFQLSGPFVVGVEGDVSFAGISGTDINEATSGRYSGQIASVIDYEINWLATLRGRVGVAFDRFMVYGTGGLAFAGETERRTQYIGTRGPDTTSPSFTEEDDATRVGWTIGGGGEFALTERWSLKGEYLYSRFGDESFRFADARGGVGGEYDTVTGRNDSNDLDLHTIKIGVNYRF